MFDHDCVECIRTHKIIEEKDKKLNICQSNLFELKSKMMETSNLINVYFSYKNENESLKKEIESLKKSNADGSVSSVNQAKVNYEV